MNDQSKKNQSITNTSTPKKSSESKIYKLLGIFFAVMRALGTALAFFTTLPLLYIAYPLYFLHPMLKKKGVRDLPLDVIQHYWAKFLLYIAGIDVVVENPDNVPLDGRPSLFLYSHASNLDPFIAMAHTPVKAPKYIFKKEILYTSPWFGVIIYLAGHIPIDRKNKERAFASIEQAAQRIQNGYSVAIFPEGSRSLTGELQPFKKGAFHLAKEAGPRIIPAVIYGNFAAWPSKALLPSPALIKLRFLTPIEHDPTLSVDQISEKVHEAMEEDIKQQGTSTLQPKVLPATSNWGRSFIFLMFLFGLVYYLFN